MKHEPRLLQSSSNPLTRQLLEAGLRDRASARSFDAAVSALIDTSASAIGQSVAGTKVVAGATSTTGGLVTIAAKWILVGVVAGSAVLVAPAAVRRIFSQTEASGSAPGNRDAAGAVGGAPRASGAQSGVQFGARRAEALGTHAPRDPSEVAGAHAGPGDPQAGPTAGVAPMAAPASEFNARSVVARSPALAAAPAATAPTPAPAAIDPASERARSIESSGVLAREAALIDGARVSVARGDLRSAEQTLEVYASSREIGVLDREALLLQIEIALQRDERVRAAALVERFATVYPSDPRVLSLRARLERRARP